MTEWFRHDETRVGTNWVEIPAETMQNMMRGGTHLQQPQFLSHPNPEFSGIPVHFVDGKWYVQIQPSNTFQIQEALRTFGVKTLGEWHAVPDRDRIQIWDGERWLEVATIDLKRLKVELPMKPPRISPEALRRIKDDLQEIEEEEERLALRQLLAESQQEEEEE